MRQLYPLKFFEIFKEKIWGSVLLKTLYKKKLPKGKRIGESWEIVWRDEIASTIKNSSLKNTSLNNIPLDLKKRILGKKIYDSYAGRFPLLIKLIDASDNVSLQVHPDDEFASRSENDWGKVEAWYVLKANPNCKLIKGLLPWVNRETFLKCINNNKVCEALNVLQVKDGELIFIPPGMVHSIKGAVLLEVEENSDVTYRIYDWDRTDLSGKPRRLHIDKAIQVIDFNGVGKLKIPPILLTEYKYKRQLLIKCEKFSMELLEFSNIIHEKKSSENFEIISFISSPGEILYGDKFSKNIYAKLMEFILIPAEITEYKIKPSRKGKVIKITPV